MLKKSLFSPAQPRCAKTHLSPSGVLASLRSPTYRSVRLRPFACCGLARGTARPWAKRLSRQTQGGRVKWLPGLGGWEVWHFWASCLVFSCCP